MDRVTPEALTLALSAIDLRAGSGRRESLTHARGLPLPTGGAALVYVLRGDIRLKGQDAKASGAPLNGGDVLLSSGGCELTLTTTESAEVVIIAVELVENAGSPPIALPDYIIVAGFDRLEPGAAALAEQMGAPDPAAKPARQSDQVICRLMATTVLLSVIRSWVENGCAPDGWPRLVDDPFLERVIAAIHDAPGDNWTVGRLAGVGAMSRSAFAQRFRISLGRSPADYVTEVRIGAAKRMLSDGRSVADTSRELGYASDEGFSRAFRRRTGVTPSAWRATQTQPSRVA